MFSSRSFYLTGNWRILSLIFNEGIFTNNTTTALTAWLDCLEARTLWFVLQTQNYIFQFFLCTLTAKTKLVFIVWWWRMYLFFPLHWYFCETQIVTHTLNTKPKTYFFRKNNYLDIMDISIKSTAGVCNTFTTTSGKVQGIFQFL